MKTLMTVLGVLVLLALVGLAAIFGASEIGGEVVTLQTIDADGSPVTTRLWIVEHDDHFWLRSGEPGSGWLQRLKANPKVIVERDGTPYEYNAVPIEGDPELRDRIHELMAENYAGAERLVSLIRDGNLSIPVRLEPR